MDGLKALKTAHQLKEKTDHSADIETEVKAAVDMYYASYHSCAR